MGQESLQGEVTQLDGLRRIVFTDLGHGVQCWRNLLLAAAPIDLCFSP
jgi:hypothetical protein